MLRGMTIVVGMGGNSNDVDLSYFITRGFINRVKCVSTVNMLHTITSRLHCIN